MEVKVRLAGPEGKELSVPFSGDMTVIDVIERLKDHFTLPAVGSKMLVFKGKILQNDAAVADCGISGGDTVFLVDENQPASWKRQSDRPESEQSEYMSDVREPCHPLQEHSQAQKEENPLLNVIREIENQVKHLCRSNEELQAAGPDPDFEAAISENCAAIARKEAMIEDLKKQLEQIEGAMPDAGSRGAADQMQVEENGGVFL